jgi:hypothetical protein
MTGSPRFELQISYNVVPLFIPLTCILLTPLLQYANNNTNRVYLWTLSDTMCLQNKLTL